MKRNPHIGSDFDEFLKEEGFLDEVQAVAVKRVVAYQLERGMKAKRLTKTAMAKRMRTTRAQLDRLRIGQQITFTTSRAGVAWRCGR